MKYSKYADRYLAAFSYRFNRRFDLRELITGLIVDVARCRPFKEEVIRVHAEARFQSGKINLRTHAGSSRSQFKDRIAKVPLGLRPRTPPGSSEGPLSRVLDGLHTLRPR